MINNLFKELGLNINQSKTKIINIVKGLIDIENYNLESTTITSISLKEKIKYLGVNFSNDTPNSMFYSSIKVKGLGITKSIWEALIQHINISRVLQRAKDPYLDKRKKIFPRRRILHEET